MLGLGTLWKAVSGGDAVPVAAPASTIPREVAKPRPAPAFEPWGDEAIQPSETRSAERFVPHRTATVLTTTGGKRVAARIINLSRTGVAVEAEPSSFTADDITLVGTRPVTPGRRIALGQVFLFKKPIDEKLCGADIVL